MIRLSRMYQSTKQSKEKGFYLSALSICSVFSQFKQCLLHVVTLMIMIVSCST